MNRELYPRYASESRSWGVLVISTLVIKEFRKVNDITVFNETVPVPVVHRSLMLEAFLTPNTSMTKLVIHNNVTLKDPLSAVGSISVDESHLRRGGSKPTPETGSGKPLVSIHLPGS